MEVNKRNAMTVAFGVVNGLMMCNDVIEAMGALNDAIIDVCNIIRFHFIPVVHDRVNPERYSEFHVLMDFTFSSMLWMLILLKQIFSERESDREASEEISKCCYGLGNAISEYMGPYATWFDSAVGSRGLNTDVDVTTFLGTLRRRDEVVGMLNHCVQLSDGLKAVGLEMDSRIGGPQVFLIQ